jgi:2-hydroxychromene-2-carboxylate isomerase
MSDDTDIGAFFFDLADPGCYIVAERILGELPVVAEWQPVHAADLGIEIPEPDRSTLDDAIVGLGLQPLRLPRQWPPDSREAMLAATFARGGGRTVAFSLAAFRQAFAAGRELGDRDTVLIAAAAAEMHPRAVLKAIGMRSVRDGLSATGERARAAGVSQLPALWLGERVLQGPEALDLALTQVATGCAGAA